MQLIGHTLVSYEPLKFVDASNEICQNCLFEFDEFLIKDALEKGVDFSIVCSEISQTIIANATGAKFIVTNQQNALKFAKLAQFYLFDSKIACIIKDESELENLAKSKVDVAIFERAIIK